MWTVRKATTSLNFLKRLLYRCEGQVLQVHLEAEWDLHTQRNVNTLEMVERGATRFVKGDYKWKSSVTSMLSGLEVITLEFILSLKLYSSFINSRPDLHWNTLQERRMQINATMLDRIVHNLFAIPATPFIIPVRTSRGHSRKFFIPQSMMNSYLYSFFPSTRLAPVLKTSFHQCVYQKRVASLTLMALF